MCFSSYGSAEVYLKIFFSDGRSDYLLAPLGTPIELTDVERLELALQFLIANAAAARVSYRALVNAHCVYERLSPGGAIDSNLISGATGSAIQGQSYNETRAVDATVISPSDLAVEHMVLDGYRVYAGASGVVGARIYDSSTQALVSTASDVNVSGPSVGIPIPIPVSATLVSGRSYRIGFYAFGNPSSSGDFFLPVFPYTESTGLFQINSAWDSTPAGDAFPQTTNQAAPRVTIRTHPI